MSRHTRPRRVYLCTYGVTASFALKDAIRLCDEFIKCWPDSQGELNPPTMKHYGGRVLRLGCAEGRWCDHKHTRPLDFELEDWCSLRDELSEALEAANRTCASCGARGGDDWLRLDNPFNLLVPASTPKELLRPPKWKHRECELAELRAHSEARKARGA